MRAALFRLGKAFAGYRRPLWLAVQRALGRRHVEVRDHATGLRFRCLRGADRMLGDVFHACLYDIPLAPVREGDLVLDIGANHGFASAYFAQRGADVLAFEPSPTVFRLLGENIEGNRLGGRVTPVQAAVGERDGTAWLREAPDLGGGMSTIDPVFAATSGAAYGAAVEVPVRAIGAVLAQVAPRQVRLLKLDCEGSELAILAALGPAERGRIDAIAVEVHANAYPPTELIRLLLAWDDFHLSHALSPGIANSVLHVVHRRAVESWSGGAA